jgi:hypothetical protein
MNRSLHIDTARGDAPPISAAAARTPPARTDMPSGNACAVAGQPGAPSTAVVTVAPDA